MIYRAWIGAVCFLAFPALSARAQVSLSWKLRDGDRFFIEETMLSKQTIGVMGKDVKQTVTTRRVSRFTVRKRTQEGIFLEQRIESWTSKTEGGPAPRNEEMLDKHSRGAIFDVHLSSGGKVVALAGYEALMKRFSADLPVAEVKLLRQIVTEPALMAPLEMTFGVLPGRDVKTGEKWGQDILIPAGPLGNFRMKTEFTYQGKSKEGERIGTTANFHYTAPTGESAAAFKITKAELKSSGSRGNLVFDNVRGRLQVLEFIFPLTGSMTVEVNGLAVDMTLDGEEQKTIRVHDKNPFRPSL